MVLNRPCPRDGRRAEGLSDILFTDLHIDPLTSCDHRPDLEEIQNALRQSPVQIDGKFDLHLAAHARPTDTQQLRKQFRQRISGIFQDLGKGHDLRARQMGIPHPVFIGDIGRGQHPHRLFLLGILDVAAHQI